MKETKKMKLDVLGSVWFFEACNVNVADSAYCFTQAIKKTSFLEAQGSQNTILTFLRR